MQPGRCRRRCIPRWRPWYRRRARSRVRRTWAPVADDRVGDRGGKRHAAREVDRRSDGAQREPVTHQGQEVCRRAIPGACAVVAADALERLASSTRRSPRVSGSVARRTAARACSTPLLSRPRPSAARASSSRPSPSNAESSHVAFRSSWSVSRQPCHPAEAVAATSSTSGVRRAGSRSIGASTRVARHGRPSAIASRATARAESRTSAPGEGGCIGSMAIEGTRAKSRASPAAGVFMPEGLTGTMPAQSGLTDRSSPDSGRYSTRHRITGSPRMASDTW